MPVHLCTACGHFCVAMAYLGSHNTDDPAHKNENVYSPAIYRKELSALLQTSKGSEGRAL